MRLSEKGELSSRNKELGKPKEFYMELTLLVRIGS